MYFALYWHVWSFPDFPGTQLINPLHVPVFSGLLRIFPLFSASDILSHSCSLSCSCHFRIFPLWPNHFTIVPVDGAVMAALFRKIPVFSTSRFLRFGPAISKLIHFMFLSFPELSASAQPSYTYSVAYSCHFWTFRFFPLWPSHK